MKLKLKKLRDQSKLNIRAAIEHMLQYKLNQWISPRRMQAYMWALTARVTEEETKAMMEDILAESLDCPWKVYVRDDKGLCYKCRAYSSPN